jgi:Cof subfamily protein (haloacid dehalogenase superfamily)
VNSDKGLSPRTRQAVAAARASGVHLVLVTGRRHPSARQVAEDLGGEIPLVLHNGALILEGGKVIRCRPLGRETARRAVHYGHDHGASPVVHCGLGGEGKLLAQASARSSTLVAYYLERSHPDVTEVADLAAALPANPIQVMFGGPQEEMDALCPGLTVVLGPEASVVRTVYPQSGMGLLDVLAPAVGKGEALAFLRERWGFSPAETLAIGDNWNDHEMLEQAGLGLVMGNADPELKRRGLPVLPSNDEDGVAVAIERYILSPANSTSP